MLPLKTPKKIHMKMKSPFLQNDFNRDEIIPVLGLGLEQQLVQIGHPVSFLNVCVSWCCFSLCIDWICKSFMCLVPADDRQRRDDAGGPGPNYNAV